MEQFKKVAVPPSDLPHQIFGAIGRMVLRDVGGTAIGMRLGVSLLGCGLGCGRGALRRGRPPTFLSSVCS